MQAARAGGPAQRITQFAISNRVSINQQRQTCRRD